MKSEGSVVFSSYIIYLDLADFFSATKPKSNVLLPFNLFDKAGAWGPTSSKGLSSYYYISGIIGGWRLTSSFCLGDY